MDIQPNLSDSNLSQPVNILNVVTSHERRYFGYNYYQKPIFVFFVVVHNYDKDTLFSKPYNHVGRVLFDLTKCIVQAVCLNKIQGCIILKLDEQIHIPEKKLQKGVTIDLDHITILFLLK